MMRGALVTYWCQTKLEHLSVRLDSSNMFSILGATGEN
jgi:hypothetical protein